MCKLLEGKRIESVYVLKEGGGGEKENERGSGERGDGGFGFLGVTQRIPGLFSFTLSISVSLRCRLDLTIIMLRLVIVCSSHALLDD